MNRKTVKKRWCSLLWVILTAGALFAETELTNRNATWSTVLSGKIIAKPETTSYGFICVTDGRTISSVSNNGMVLWEKPIYGASSPLLKTISDDFTVAITNSNQKITLINPSGVELWNKASLWEITESPYEGRDGRFFLRGNENICCYGINGICKWEITTEEQNEIPLQELPDGSIIIFLEKLSKNENEANKDGGGKTRAIRVSPFGRILEEITFAGEVVNSATSSEGILLTFTDGSAGLFSLENNKAVNKWTLKSDSIAFQKSRCNFFAASKDSIDCYFLTKSQNGINAFKIDSKTGVVKSEFTIPELDLEDLVDFYVGNDGFLVFDTKKACYFTENDNLVWSGNFPDRKNEKWNFAFVSSNKGLVFAYENWTITSYRISQSVSSKTNIAKKKSYSSFYSVSTSFYDDIFKNVPNEYLISKDRLMRLRSGFYGEKEIAFVSETKSAVTAYLRHLNSTDFGARIEKSVFETNSSVVESLYSQMPCFGTDEFIHQTATLILTEKNPSFMNILLSEIKKNGYDPNGEILGALQKLADSVSKPSPALAENICDAVYSICRFMGRPAFNRSGNKILSKFLSTNSSAKARDTLKALSELDF